MNWKLLPLAAITLPKSKSKKLANHTAQVSRCESRGRFFTYNQLPNDKRVWHIHGEARTPDSMVLGHYFYGNTVARMKVYLEQYGGLYSHYQKQGQSKPLRSWLDAFILGNVYVLGFGFDLSKFDIWWLLNRKKLEKANHGKVYFYQPRTVGFDERLELLKLMEVEILDCGFAESYGRPCDYRAFYNAAIHDIKQKLERK